MKKTITIEATVPAYLMPHHRVTTLLERARTGKPCTDMISYWTFQPPKEYTRIGEAHIVIELGTEDEMVQAQIAALKSEIDAARAAFHEKQQKILEEISKLSAIEYVQEAAS